MQAFTALLTFAVAVAAQVNSTPCASQPAGYGPVPTPNTDAAFSTFNAYAAAAHGALTPPLYQQAFVNLNGSQQATSSNVYLGYYELKQYDPAACTTICDKTSGCVGVNLYFERDPSLWPDTACPNPTALVVIKCALWGSPIVAAEATNYGQWQAQFHVLIAGSNGYMKLPSQAYSAIQSAWKGNNYAWPTQAVNWQGWTSIFGSAISSKAWPSSAMAQPTGTANGGRGGW